MSTTPPEESFTPRKEFIRDNNTQQSTFALLALSGANCVRLYSFTPGVLAALTRLFESHRILSFREDTVHNLSEFTLDGKPWANPKSVPSEKLLLDIIAIIYQRGFTYLSTIDYGREQDDRLVLTFARPLLCATRTSTSVPHSAPPGQERSSNSTAGLGEGPKAKRVPFALSFASVTVMRVISPPLHLTPAILQAVRGSWPRGVVSERKVGDNSYEFKLKGYKWFQQDTFATDSLRHILALLTSLDTHSFSLLASLSLTNRSRVKDLWIFTGPAFEDAGDSAFLEVPQGSIGSSPPTAESFGDTSLESGAPLIHRRLATEPAPTIPHTSPPVLHARAATETQRRIPHQPHLLRKPAPRAQVPVSVIQDPDAPDDVVGPILRVNLPSTISTGVENMTGVGASPNLFYSTSPFENNERGPPMPSPRARMTSMGSNRVPVRPTLNRTNTSPFLDTSAPPTPEKKITPANSSHRTTPSKEEAEWIPKLPPLLGLDTFRDSGMSGSSDLSREVPIKWTGPLTDEFRLRVERPVSKRNRASSTPQFPGGWRPTPVSEKSQDSLLTPPEDKKVTTPIHEMSSRVEAPAVVRPEIELQKSEAALVGIITATTSIPPLAQRRNSQRQAPTGTSSNGQGWVMVNVEGSSRHAVPDAPPPAETSSTPQLAESGPSGLRASTPSSKSSNHSSTRSRPSPLSVDRGPGPAAKAIVIIDAMESKHKKRRSMAAGKDGISGNSKLKRFFSLNRKNSIQTKDAEVRADEEGMSSKDSNTSSSHTLPRSQIRDRLRLIGTPEASRREDKRRSVD